jgi:hypothetical protein
MRDITKVTYPDPRDHKAMDAMLTDLAEYIGITESEVTDFWTGLPIGLRMQTKPGSPVETMFESLASLYQNSGKRLKR